jgi:predicted secreted hydrolase
MKRNLFLLILVCLVGGILVVRGKLSAERQATTPIQSLAEGEPAAGFARADGSHGWEFPRDFGAHPNYQTEWWYYTGNLESESGRRFGYQLTFFRRGLVPSQEFAPRGSRWAANQVYMGHFALSDIQAGEHFFFERFSRGSADLAGVQVDPYQVWLENWQVVQTSEGKYQLQAAQGGIQIDLALLDLKGPILNGQEGFSLKGSGEGNASYYFSQTRLATQGTVGISGEEFLVSGLSWMDHEFSTSALSPGQVGWDWFSLQLSDGSDLMVFQIRRSDGSIDPFSSGTLVTPDGEAYHLSEGQFKIQVVNTWHSPHSDAQYPASWVLEVPSIGLILEIEPYMDDQEVNAAYVYWEGAVGFEGTYGDKLVQGSGYVEMTGYATSMEGEF